MAHHSRRYLEAKEFVEPGRAYPLEEAIAKLKQMPPAGFDETVACTVTMGIDPRQSDQQVRGNISLPHGTGQSRTVAVFAEGPAAAQAEEAGADYVGADDLIARVEDGFMDFDVALATPDMMSRIGRLGRYLGPRGLMPSPKSGTVRDDIAEAVQEFKAGMLEFRNDSGGNVHVPVGKLSFSTEQLANNLRAFLEQLLRMRPPATRGRYLQQCFVAATMSPSVEVEL